MHEKRIWVWQTGRLVASGCCVVSVRVHSWNPLHWIANVIDWVRPTAYPPDYIMRG